MIPPRPEKSFKDALEELAVLLKREKLHYFSPIYMSEKEGPKYERLLKKSRTLFAVINETHPLRDLARRYPKRDVVEMLLAPSSDKSGSTFFHYYLAYTSDLEFDVFEDFVRATGEDFEKVFLNTKNRYGFSLMHTVFLNRCFGDATFVSRFVSLFEDLSLIGMLYENTDNDGLNCLHFFFSYNHYITQESIRTLLERLGKLEGGLDLWILRNKNKYGRNPLHFFFGFNPKVADISTLRCVLELFSGSREKFKRFFLDCRNVDGYSPLFLLFGFNRNLTAAAFVETLRFLERFDLGDEVHLETGHTIVECLYAYNYGLQDIQAIVLKTLDLDADVVARVMPLMFANVRPSLAVVEKIFSDQRLASLFLHADTPPTPYEIVVSSSDRLPECVVRSLVENLPSMGILSDQAKLGLFRHAYASGVPPELVESRMDAHDGIFYDYCEVILYGSSSDRSIHNTEYFKHFMLRRSGGSCGVSEFAERLAEKFPPNLFSEDTTGKRRMSSSHLYSLQLKYLKSIERMFGDFLDAEWFRLALFYILPKVKIFPCPFERFVVVAAHLLFKPRRIYDVVSGESFAESASQEFRDGVRRAFRLMLLVLHKEVSRGRVAVPDASWSHDELAEKFLDGTLEQLRDFLPLNLRSRAKSKRCESMRAMIGSVACTRDPLLMYRVYKYEVLLPSRDPFIRNFFNEFRDNVILNDSGDSGDGSRVIKAAWREYHVNAELLMRRIRM